MIKVYHASAGSGKTFRLTRDYIYLLFAPGKQNQHRHILAVTFTNKATGEMKSRILDELYSLATGTKSPYREDLMKDFGLSAQAVNSKARELLTLILHDYSSFTISTIDRFFQQVIRAFAREIGVHGGYTLELDTSEVLEQAVDNIFLDLSEKENKQLLDWMTQYAEEKIEQSEHWNLRQGIISLGYEIFKENYQYKAEATNQKLHDREFLKVYRKELQLISEGFARRVKTKAEAGLSILRNQGLELSDFKGSSRSAIFYLEKFAQGKYELKPTFSKLAKDVHECYTKTTPYDKIRAIETAYSGGLQSCMNDLIHLLEVDIVGYNTVGVIRKHLNTLGILSDLAMQIRKLTSGQNVMLIADSNLMLNKIIDESDSPFIYEKTGSFINHFMIDEFQDTSVLQWKNFLPLIRNSISSGQFNLVVGDVKQSIYRWRNSDWNLLDSQVYQDFSKESLVDETLGTNYRSDKNIIGFNNEFFAVASATLQEMLNANMEGAMEALPQLSELTTKISGAYQDLRQETPANAGNGHVKINFIDASDSDEDWKEISLNSLPAILEDFQERGYKPSDVAILIRKNDEVPLIVNKLLQYKTSPEARPGFSYDIMGTEGLLPASSATIRFILGLMQLFINPVDTVQQAIVNYEYARGRLRMSENEAITKAFMRSDDPQIVSPLFSVEENRTLNQLKHISLFEMTGQIISLFELQHWHNELIFLQAFQDMIFRFSTGRATDLNSFLQWWERFGCKESITTPDNDSAFRIMTVHKSKGLDFKAVVMPFCDWDLDSRMRNILWCETDVEPFNQLPLMPVEYTSGLSRTIFAGQYFREMMHTYIDNLNVAYVAFTRSKHALICNCRLPKRNKDGVYSVKSIATLLYHSLESTTNDFLKANFRVDENVFEAGTATSPPASVEKSTSQVEKLTDYPICQLGDRLKVRHRIGKLNREETSIDESPIDYGNLMHELLSGIRNKADCQQIIGQFYNEGRITHDDKSLIEAEMDAFWAIPETDDWFGEGLKVLNETTILTPGGINYRPDRVILNDNLATVIDYKFGLQEHPAHQKQIKNYADLLEQMGYATQGSLCYVRLRKVVHVV